MSDRDVSHEAEQWLRAQAAQPPEPPAPTRRRCDWPIIGRWMHKWGRWESCRGFGIEKFYQRRICAACGLCQEKHV